MVGRLVEIAQSYVVVDVLDYSQFNVVINMRDVVGNLDLGDLVSIEGKYLIEGNHPFTYNYDVYEEQCIEDTEWYYQFHEKATNENLVDADTDLPF